MSDPMFFDLDVANPEPPKDGFSFRAGGELFHCKAAVPLGTLNRVMSGFQASGGQLIAVPDLCAFVRECLIDENVITIEGENGEEQVSEPADDRQRWDDLMEDDSRPIYPSALYELQGKLMAHYSGRPTRARRR